MATDNAVMRYKDIKYYNEKLQDSMPSGGGVSSLADLGITLTAEQINNLPTDKYAFTDVFIEIPYSASSSTVMREKHYLSYTEFNNICALTDLYGAEHRGNVRLGIDSTYVSIDIDYTQPSTMNDIVWARIFYKKAG